MKEIDYYINDIDLVNILLNCKLFNGSDFKQIFALNDRKETKVLIELFINNDCFYKESWNYIKTDKFTQYLLNKKIDGFQAESNPKQ